MPATSIAFASNENSSAHAVSCAQLKKGYFPFEDETFAFFFPVITGRNSTSLYAFQSAGILPPNGSKSTNQDLKIACAWDSKFWFIFSLSSILLSSVCNILLIDPWVSNEGNSISILPISFKFIFGWADCPDIEFMYFIIFFCFK